MDTTHPRSLYLNARALRASFLVVLKQVDGLTDLIEGRAESTVDSGHRSRPTLSELRVERPTLSVIWLGRTCYFGNALPFRLIERLARSPGHFVRAIYSVEELWGGPLAASTVRGAFSHLRARLAGGGMADLAEPISGSNQGHYGILVRRSQARSDSNQTAFRQRANKPTA